MVFSLYLIIGLFWQAWSLWGNREHYREVLLSLPFPSPISALIGTIAALMVGLTWPAALAEAIRSGLRL